MPLWLPPCQALHIDTPYFDGDPLASNNEKCKEQAGFGGMNLYDVTNPAHPTPLAEGVGDFTVNGQGKKAANDSHSVFAWDAGDKAYAVSTTKRPPMSTSSTSPTRRRPS